MKADSQNPLRLKSMNHVSFVCGSLADSVSFYRDVLGFVQIRRPGSFDFDGAWLFGYGFGIHLLQSEDRMKKTKKREINPKDDHISFQCESMEEVEKKLEEMGINYVCAVVEEGGIRVDQIFLHDPDGFMIEICNCDNIPVVPISDNESPPSSPINHKGDAAVASAGNRAASPPTRGITHSSKGSPRFLKTGSINIDWDFSPFSFQFVRCIRKCIQLVYPS
ncbi:hypothetical protein MLD38_030170 [Melastoma candidum]|uniref:Uncharacterized protein n=1 Tax=Melastoma candidum TaxID=119954 RepID=A0ACB9MR53_9MYRT|nr:hypothetical protein MLD38_030170 [Melastoma candidum]